MLPASWLKVIVIIFWVSTIYGLNPACQGKIYWLVRWGESVCVSLSNVGSVYIVWAITLATSIFQMWIEHAKHYCLLWYYPGFIIWWKCIWFRFNYILWPWDSKARECTTWHSKSVVITIKKSCPLSDIDWRMRGQLQIGIFIVTVCNWLLSLGIVFDAVISHAYTLMAKLIFYCYGLWINKVAILCQPMKKYYALIKS